jgi:hypothetical protein
MKFVQKLVLPVLFVSVLAINAYAGEIQTPGYTAPPPPQHSISDTPTTDENLPYEQIEPTDRPSDQLLYNAITAMLSLF